MPPYDLTPPLRPIPLHPATGSLEPERIYGRDRTVQHIHTTVRGHGRNVLVVDPRRIGKTLTMHRTNHLLPDGWRGVYGDFEGVATRRAVVERLGRLIRDHAGFGARMHAFLEPWFGSAELRAGPAVLRLNRAWEAAPLDALQGLLRSLNHRLSEEDAHLLITWDEAPMMLQTLLIEEGTGAALEMMTTLRNLQTDATLDRVRWIMTGSVGFHHVLRSMGQTTGHLNHLEPVTIGPLDPAWATWLADSYLMGLGARSAAGAAEALATGGGNIPFIIQTVARQIGNERPVSADTVRRARDRTFRDPDISIGLRHYTERVAPFYGPDAPLAEAVLDATARGVDDLEVLRNGAAMESDRFVDVVQWLQHDHYLAIDGGSVRWRYPVLAEIWNAGRRGRS